MNTSETAAHLELKRLALVWAQTQGYRIAAAEVSLPNYRFRLDVAAYKALQIRELPLKGRRPQLRAALGIGAVFECKASKVDYRRDSRSLILTTQRLKLLHERRLRIEEELYLHYPSILNGDSLFQEYQTVDYQRPGHERYQRILLEIQRLAVRLHANTKFDRLVHWNAANLFFVVAEPNIVAAHEIPGGWGLLERAGDRLDLLIKPTFQEISDAQRLALLHRIAFAATRAVNREHQIHFEDLQQGS